MSNLHNIIPGTEVEAELDWDSEIEKDAGSLVLLADGEYDYEVAVRASGFSSGLVSSL